ncbi:cell wall hydrolase [Aneurinibacillus sp. BA2021]|nr:cell wall hydrolase [Aneurinibacillus sp. BA2021]
MKKRTITTAILAALLTSTLGAGASEAASSSVTVNGQAVHTAYFLQNDSMMVPAVFFQHMGVIVGWNEDYHAVTLSKGDMIIGLPSGARYADVYTKQSGTWTRDILKTTTTDRVDGTYVPLRYVAERLGIQLTGTSPASVSLSTKQANPKPAAPEKTSYSEEEISWLYKLTEAEAGGEPYKGKVAVAASVLNRVESPNWPNTLKEVIFQVDTYNGKQYYQYSPVLDKRIYQVKPSSDTIAAVQEALRGSDPSREALIFYNPDKTDNQWVRSHTTTAKIGSHIFSK